jgi:hypothetical protein
MTILHEVKTRIYSYVFILLIGAALFSSCKKEIELTTAGPLLRRLNRSQNWKHNVPISIQNTIHLEVFLVWYNENVWIARQYIYFKPCLAPCSGSAAICLLLMFASLLMFAH